MPALAGGVALSGVRLTSTRTHGWVAAVLAVALLAGGALAATSSPSRHALLEQLQRPARPSNASPTRGGQLWRRSSMGYLMTVALAPNRADGPIRLSVHVRRSGRPVERARIEVAFSMPSMNMWNGYATRLSAVGHGSYAATVPVLGMPGRWRLRFELTTQGSAPPPITIDDRVAP
jgi:hypothetical protein